MPVVRVVSNLSESELQADAWARGKRHANGQTGHPALSFPVGMLANDAGVRLPVGMQLVGRRWDEGTLYAAAYAWEQANDWKAFS